MPYNYLQAGFVWPWFVEILRGTRPFWFSVIQAWFVWPWFVETLRREAEARCSDFVLRTRLELVQAFLPKGF
jgi:hypothetical protein